MLMTSAETTSASIAKLKDQLKKNEQEQKALKSTIVNVQSGINSMIDTKAYLDSQINMKSDKITITEKLIEEYEKEIGEMKNKLAEKESRLDKEYESLRLQFRLSYEEKDKSYFEILFSSESLVDFLVNAERTAVLLDYEKNQLSELNAQAEDLNNLKKSIEKENADAEATKKQFEIDKKDLEKSRYDATQYIKKQSDVLNKSKDKYDELAKKNNDLDAELDKQLKALAAQSKKAYVGGEFIWPVNPSFSRITTGFQPRTLYGVSEFHRGIDIPANGGSNVYASNSGTVVTAAFHSSYGNYVVIDHGGGKATLYAHNSKLLVKVGDNVKQGDVIALVGTTGYSFGNHCHFEMRINGVAHNPLDYVSRP